MKPYPHQIQILEAVHKGWEEYDKQLVVSPTGSGKTLTFSWMAQEVVEGGERALILVDQDELVWQALDKLKSATGIVGQAEKAEHNASHGAPVVVSTIQSMMRRLDRWPQDHFSLVIADEADKSISDSWQSVLKHFDPHAQVCGFTATPWRTDCRNLGCYYENIAAEVKLFDLIDQGYLSKIVVKMLPISIDLGGVRVKDGDYDKNDLDLALEPYLLEAAKAIKQHASFRKTMVFLPLIKTSEKFVEACRSIGLAAEHVDGESSDRKEKLQRFARWEFDVLANSALLLRGYDDPQIDCIVMLRPTKSLSLYAQAIGRGTRIHETKENLLLLDFLWQHQKHSLCRPAHLIAKTEEEAEVITEMAQQQAAAMPGEVAKQMPLDLQQLAGAATQQREESLRKKLDEHRNKKAKVISAEEFALQHNSLETAEFEPTMKWESNQLTEKQAKVLKRAKIDLATVRGRGHASKLIDLIFRNQKLTLASPKQQALMRRLGHPNPDTATAQEARQFMAKLRQPKQEELC